MDERFWVYVVGLIILLLTLGLKHASSPLWYEDEGEDEEENALDVLLMYEMSEEDD